MIDIRRDNLLMHLMFKALFLEGFARPFEGVRVVLRVLLAKYRAAGGERRIAAKGLEHRGQRVHALCDLRHGYALAPAVSPSIQP